MPLPERAQVNPSSAAVSSTDQSAPHHKALEENTSAQTHFSSNFGLEQSEDSQAPASAASLSLSSKDPSLSASLLPSRAPETKPSMVTEPAPSSNWIVVAATFKNRAQGEAAEKKIKKLKLPRSVEATQRDGKTYYRLILGPFTSREGALAARNQVVQAKIVKGELYIKQLER